MKNKIIVKVLLIMTTISILLCVVGFSYAYFSTDVNGEGKYITLDTAELRLKYTDDVTMSLNNAIPGDKIERTFTVENIGTKTVSYNIVWKDLINTINNYDLHLDMKCKSYKNYGKSNQEEYGTCDSFYKAVPTTETSISKDIRRDIEIEVGVTQVYDVTITFLNRPYDQSENLNKSFSGKIDLEEYIDPSPEPIYCTYDGELVQGAEYVNGQYTYRYMQAANYNTSNELIWNNVRKEGWGVTLTDKDSTVPVTSKVCTYINDKPILYTSSMFNSSKATSIDLTSFNTNNVVDMASVFNGSQAIEIKGLETFNTKNVTTMTHMFYGIKVDRLDLSSFDTRNVMDMSYMFRDSSATTIVGLDDFDTNNLGSIYCMFWGSSVETLNLSSFNTSKIKNMGHVFRNSDAKNIYGLENFNTSNVTSMNNMFSNSKAIVLDLTNFDTSKVDNMSTTFGGTQAENIYGLENFDTSNVTDMQSMFSNSKASILNVYNFNTSKVTNMKSMFYNSQATVINGLENFYTSNVTDMSNMFHNVNTLYLDLSNFDTSNVTDMQSMFSNGKLNKLDISNFNTSKVTNMKSMFYSSKIDKLDLSSFDLSNIETMNLMFWGSAATTGYAKDEETASKFNDSSITNIPNTLKFVVK